MSEPTRIPVFTEGEIQIPAPATQRGVDAVHDLGLDNSGSDDCAPVLSDYLNTDDDAVEIHFAPGVYYFGSTVETDCGQVRLVGDCHTSNISAGPVRFVTDQWLDSLLWFHTRETASNLESCWLEHLQFCDTSAQNNHLRAAVRITNQANFVLDDVCGYNLIPRRYTEGTVTVTEGSQHVDGAGTDWSSAELMPGFLIVGGYPYEILAVDSPTSIRLALQYCGPSAAGLHYAISAGGILLWCDPGAGFTQYGQVTNLRGRCGCGVYMGAGNGATGTSRVKIWGGYLNGKSLPDSIACYLGPYSDTVLFSAACNNFAFGVVIANGHQHDIAHADFENAGAAPPVTGGEPGYAGGKAVLIMGDNASDTWGNRVVDCYMRQVGTAIELYGRKGSAPTWSKIAWNTFRSNDRNFENGQATNTAGEVDGVFYGSAYNRSHHSDRD